MLLNYFSLLIELVYIVKCVLVSNFIPHLLKTNYLVYFQGIYLSLSYFLLRIWDFLLKIY